MTPLDTEFTHLKNNPIGDVNAHGVRALGLPLIQKFTSIITHMKRLHNRRPSTTGPLDLTLLPWTRRRSLAVDLLLSLSDRVAEIGGAIHG